MRSGLPISAARCVTVILSGVTTRHSAPFNTSSRTMSTLLVLHATISGVYPLRGCTGFPTRSSQEQAGWREIGQRKSRRTLLSSSLGHDVSALAIERFHIRATCGACLDL